MLMRSCIPFTLVDLAFRSVQIEIIALLPEVRPTGKQLGVGSYGSVEEVEVNGLVCAGKRLHDGFVEQGNAGVANITRKYLRECQVMPCLLNILP